MHEACHAIIAAKLGYKIGRINLLFSGAVLEAESDEFTFSDEIKISASGPLFNLAFAFLIVAFWWIWPESYNYTLDLCIVNFAIFVFNISIKNKSYFSSKYIEFIIFIIIFIFSSIKE